MNMKSQILLLATSASLMGTEDAREYIRQWFDKLTDEERERAAREIEAIANDLFKAFEPTIAACRQAATDLVEACKANVTLQDLLVNRPSVNRPPVNRPSATARAAQDERSSQIRSIYRK
jgi:hypothetical protein